LFLDGDPEASRENFCCHIATRTRSARIDEVANGARFKSADSADIAKLALANYFAGALVMPHGRFS
jgi:predicted transcriptional regulator